MEVKEKSKKRELIKTIAIVFLAVLLVLTLFSNTIMNYSLPEVATQRITSGTINARIRGSGTVAATESYEVIIDQTREVRTVCVKVGDSVEQGDVLFILGDMESTELQTAQDTLRDLNTQYQTRLLQLSKTYATDDREVEKMQEDLEKATKDRDENLVTQADETALVNAKGEVTAAKNEVKRLEAAIKDLNRTMSSDETVAKAQELVSELKSEISSLEGEISSLEGSIESQTDGIRALEKQYEDIQGGNTSLERQIEDARQAVDVAYSAVASAQNKQTSDWIAYNAVLWEFFGQVEAAYKTPMTQSDWTAWKEYESYLNASGTGFSEPFPLNATQQIYCEAYLTDANRAQTPAVSGGESEDSGAETAAEPPVPDTQYTLRDYQTVYTALLADQSAVAEAEQAYYDAQTALQRLQADLGIAIGDINDDRGDKLEEISEAREKLRKTQLELSDANTQMQSLQLQLQDAQLSLDAAKEANSGLQKQIDDTTAAMEAAQDVAADLEKTATDMETELNEKKAAYEAAVNSVASAQRALEDYLTGKDIDKQLNNLELQNMRDDISRQQEAVDKLKADVIDTEVKANVSGTVTAINVSAGKETTAGSAMAVIDVVDRGYTVRVSVTREQAQQVKPGDTAEVTNYYGWGRTLEATLEQIVADPESQGQRRILVFRVTGDVDPGTNITLSIGQRSTTMDTIVPKSALREDSNGHFVLVVTSRSTPLGNRYTATRVDVEVLAEDDTNAAVSGLTANDYVITTSSAPLAAGSQVRLVEDPS